MDARADEARTRWPSRWPDGRGRDVSRELTSASVEELTNSVVSKNDLDREMMLKVPEEQRNLREKTRCEGARRSEKSRPRVELLIG